MKIHQAFKYELRPNNKQVGLFIKCCGVSRFAYNWGLEQREELYRTKQGNERFTTIITQNNKLNAIKKSEYPWMYEVSKSVPQEALRDVGSAYANFFRGLKTHENIGKPKFKKKSTHDNFRLTCRLSVGVSYIRLSRIGRVRTKESTSKFKGRILSATVSHEADRWFCSLCVEVERPNPKPVYGDVVGIDLGLDCFAVVSNGIKHIHKNAPNPLKNNLKKLRRVCRQHTRKRLSSNNHKKSNLKLTKLHRKIRNIRKDFLNKLTTELAKTKSVIVIEDLAVGNMAKNRYLKRSILDVGWGDFREKLEYKSTWYGSRLIKIPRFEPSSKRCHICGEINHDLKLSSRTWICLKCGTLHNRDENASDNIRDYGIKVLATESSSGSQACGVGISPQQSEAIHDETGNKHIYN